MAARRGAAVLLCVHAGRIRGRVFRGKAALSAHRYGRGALGGQLHAFPAGAVRLHVAVRPVFLRVRLRLWQLGRCRLGAFRATPEKAAPPQKAVPSAGAGGALGAEGQISAAGWASAGLSETKKGGRRTVFVQQPPFGWEIYYFGTPERLRTLRRLIFTGKASAPAGLSCCAG